MAEAEGQAEAIRLVQQATADGIRMIMEADPNEKVISLKSLDAFTAAADGKATKIIIPSEIQGLAGLASSLKGILADGTPGEMIPDRSGKSAAEGDKKVIKSEIKSGSAGGNRKMKRFIEDHITWKKLAPHDRGEFLLNVEHASVIRETQKLNLDLSLNFIIFLLRRSEVGDGGFQERDRRAYRGILSFPL